MRREPTRTCVGCRGRRPKAAMVRLVRRTDGRVVVDALGPGRGAYVCAEAACVERALKPGRLSHAFRGRSQASPGLAEAVGAAARAGEDRAGEVVEAMGVRGRWAAPGGRWQGVEVNEVGGR